MLWILSGLSLILAFFYMKTSRYVPLFICICVILVCMGCMLLMMSPSGETEEITNKKSLVSEREIVTLQDTSQLEGASSIEGKRRLFSEQLSGTFVIDEGEKYIYYYKTKDGGYRQGKLKAEENIVIYEEKDCKKPSVREYKISKVRVTHYYYTEKHLKFEQVLMFFMEEDFEHTEVLKTSTKYEIHVPKGTIVHEFVLDAQ